MTEEKRIKEEVVSAIRETVMIVRHLVNNPDDVKVEIERHGYSLLVLLYTNPDDVGQVIGRNAHIITSVRSFIAAISGKNNVRVVLDYVTEGDNKRSSSGYDNSNRYRRSS